MISRHKEIALDEAIAGITLSRDVLDSKGGVLLQQGTVLTDALLASLRRRGFDTIHVANDDVSEEELQIAREQTRQRIAKLFRGSRGEPAAEALFAAVTQYRLEDL